MYGQSVFETLFIILCHKARPERAKLNKPKNICTHFTIERLRLRQFADGPDLHKEMLKVTTKARQLLVMSTKFHHKPLKSSTTQSRPGRLTFLVAKDSHNHKRLKSSSVQDLPHGCEWKRFA